MLPALPVWRRGYTPVSFFLTTHSRWAPWPPRSSSAPSPARASSGST
ncbi:MAG: hypothetical protein M0C28_46170 [Candidatus Moduliflexus flocculans]|nr:hypothetical protein [Candidatus Moduliflexus flocculans]